MSIYDYELWKSMNVLFAFVYLYTLIPSYLITFMYVDVYQDIAALVAYS